MRGKAFLVVGHARWGKSSTLIALTGSHHHRKHRIGGQVCRIRRTSNDDQHEPWVTALKGFQPSKDKYLIIAACPTKRAQGPLVALKKKYNLYFWVMAIKQHGYHDEVTNDQVAKLKSLGVVSILKSRREPRARAALLVRFIKAYL